MEKKIAYPIRQSENAEWSERNMAALISQFHDVWSRLTRVCGCGWWIFFLSLKHKNHHSQEESRHFSVTTVLLFVRIVDTDVSNRLVPTSSSAILEFYNSYEMEGKVPLNSNKAKSFDSEGDLVWLVWFYGISTFVGYLTSNPFLCK